MALNSEDKSIDLGDGVVLHVLFTDKGKVRASLLNMRLFHSLGFCAGLLGKAEALNDEPYNLEPLSDVFHERGGCGALQGEPWSVWEGELLPLIVTDCFCWGWKRTL